MKKQFTPERREGIARVFDALAVAAIIGSTSYFWKDNASVIESIGLFFVGLGLIACAFFTRKKKVEL